MRSEIEEKAAVKYQEFVDKNTAWHLHEELESARSAVQRAKHGCKMEAKADYEDCLKKRVEFWSDTFLYMPDCGTARRAELYETFGRHLKQPSTKLIKEVLTALDDHSPDWG